MCKQCNNCNNCIYSKQVSTICDYVVDYECWHPDNTETCPVSGEVKTVKKCGTNYNALNCKRYTEATNLMFSMVFYIGLVIFLIVMISILACDKKKTTEMEDIKHPTSPLGSIKIELKNSAFMFNIAPTLNEFLNLTSKTGENSWHCATLTPYHTEPIDSSWTTVSCSLIKDEHKGGNYYKAKAPNVKNPTDKFFSEFIGYFELTLKDKSIISDRTVFNEILGQSSKLWGENIGNWSCHEANPYQNIDTGIQINCALRRRQ